MKINELHIQDEQGNDYEFVTGLKSSYDEDTKTLSFEAGEGKVVPKELTEEHLTGEAFNGKPVYSGYISFNITAAGANYYPISIPDIKEIVSHQTFFYHSGGQYTNFYLSTSSFLCEVGLQKTQAYINSKGISYPSKCSIFVKYTKTTD